MAIIVRGLTLGLDEPEDLLPIEAAKRLHVSVDQIRLWAVVRRSLDARKRGPIRRTYNVELALADTPQAEQKLVQRLGRNDTAMLKIEKAPVIRPGKASMGGPPVIIGFGPAGMFAGLWLAQQGYAPIIVERGQGVTERHRDVMVDYYTNRKFNAESNLLFGEGGAGTYSDGKLYTRVKDPRARYVLETLYQNGANPDILIDGKPHVGSDKLPGICRRIRMRINELGGEVRFGNRLDDVVIEDGQITGVVVNGETIACGPVLMGVGQSARDTLRMLHRKGVMFETKPFQLGVRIEHPQAAIDKWQYGQHCGNVNLPAAEYQLVAKGAAGELGDMFSFCMCPGGTILPTNESPGMIATNGASKSNRNSPFGNAGLVMTLDPAIDVPGADTNPLAALDYLEAIERRAFAMTGESYRVPAQRAGDYLKFRKSDGEINMSYPLGGQWADLRELLPQQLGQALGQALALLEERIPGFAGPDAMLAAPETRASGPVRMTRDHLTRESISTRSLYPVGEGAGYAGGIISAAIDGLRSAELIMSRYARNDRAAD